MCFQRSTALVILFCILTYGLTAQMVLVHFIHGSKPRAAFRHTEKKWRGGLWGGHVGLEFESDCVVDFFPKGKVHWVAKRGRAEGQFAVRNREGFWGYFGLPSDSLRRTTVTIPISDEQSKRLGNLVWGYAQRSPYDYAFFGMRCTSASYDLLMESGILKKHARHSIVLRYFYPRKLRKHLLRLANEQGWEVWESAGGARRRWSEK